MTSGRLARPTLFNAAIHSWCPSRASAGTPVARSIRRTPRLLRVLCPEPPRASSLRPTHDIAPPPRCYLDGQDRVAAAVQVQDRNPVARERHGSIDGVVFSETAGEFLRGYPMGNGRLRQAWKPRGSGGRFESAGFPALLDRLRITVFVRSYFSWCNHFDGHICASHPLNLNGAVLPNFGGLVHPLARGPTLATFCSATMRRASGTPCSSLRRSMCYICERLPTREVASLLHR